MDTFLMLLLLVLFCLPGIGIALFLVYSFIVGFMGPQKMDEFIDSARWTNRK
jgi:hypothetical protein